VERWREPIPTEGALEISVKLGVISAPFDFADEMR
jgi:hypothetical protein